MARHQDPNGTGATHSGGTVRGHAPGAAVLEDQLVTGDHVLVVVSVSVCAFRVLGQNLPQFVVPNTWRIMMATENMKSCPYTGSHIYIYIHTYIHTSMYGMKWYGKVTSHHVNGTLS